MMQDEITKPAEASVSEKTRQAVEKHKNAPDDITSGLAADPDRPTGEAPTRFGDWEKKGRCIDF